MKRAAGLIVLSVIVGCNGSHPVNPTSPGLIDPGGASSGAEARAVLRVPGDFATIQAAVDAAASGDTIEVASGTYCEHVVITKSDLRLHSPAGRPAILNGECLGKLGAGIHVMNAARVEIMGFVVEHFEFGIQLMSTTDSRIHLNEARFNRTVVRPGVPGGSRGVGIQLSASNLNTVSQNELHENGRNGVQVWGSSSGNIVRANRLKDNNLENSLTNAACNLMVGGGASDNSVVENEIVGTFGVGIMLGSGVSTGNRVAQNRIHGFGGPGIIALSVAAGNVIEQNNAQGNGLLSASPQNVDLFDATNPVVDNTWSRNLGTCGPGVC
jgi:parallel beta-helix repeat protein